MNQNNQFNKHFMNNLIRQAAGRLPNAPAINGTAQKPVASNDRISIGNVGSVGNAGSGLSETLAPAQNISGWLREQLVKAA